MIEFKCPQCGENLKGREDAAGKRGKCPNCGEFLRVPKEELATLEVAAPDPILPRRPMANSPVRAAPAPTPTGASPTLDQNIPLFLYIPTSRLIILSIVSVGLYEAYWIYRNWRYIKERDGLNIHPFWRGWFGIFFIRRLLRRIHEDECARSFQQPTFSPGRLGLAWMALFIVGAVVSRQVGILAAFIPSFLCLVPVQNYVNAVTKKRSPGLEYYGWSAGHIICLVWGILLWTLTLIGVGLLIGMAAGQPPALPPCP